ncbi:uncharacterized protein BDV17DRAFT_284430 [Aspergillus undulatus]|uniref:uncharacterized protein n=1 Tax=Aspergillus undulatus TaxID=1810928 RepID=UPI003CCE0816
MRRLVEHFRQWEHYYADDANKIAEATRHLSGGIGVSSNIRNFVNPDVAERRYQAARQRKTQSESRFAAMLGSLEMNLPRLVTDYERCQRLWEGVLPQIRHASLPGFPTTYHTGVTDLCAAGRSLTRGRRREHRGERADEEERLAKIRKIMCANKNMN